MSALNLHAISNDYQRFRLVSLRTWAGAARFEDRDPSGPYLVSQAAYDPEDNEMTPEEFLLGRSGNWLSTRWFFRLPSEIRRRQYIFATVAELIEVIQGLPPRVAVLHPGPDQLGAPVTNPECEQLRAVFGQSAREALPLDPPASAYGRVRK